MARQSAQHKLDRVRPPRVQITYDVEIGGAIELKELVQGSRTVHVHDHEFEFVRRQRSQNSGELRKRLNRRTAKRICGRCSTLRAFATAG